MGQKSSKGRRETHSSKDRRKKKRKGKRMITSNMILSVTLHVLTTHLLLHVTLNYFAGFARYLGGKDKSIIVNEYAQNLSSILIFLSLKRRAYSTTNKTKSNQETHMRACKLQFHHQYCLSVVLLKYI